MMLLMLLTGMMYMWNQNEIFWWNRTVSSGGGRSHFGTAPFGQVKVQWKHLSPKEATWELESNMRDAYPILFQGNSEDEE